MTIHVGLTKHPELKVTTTMTANATEATPAPTSPTPTVEAAPKAPVKAPAKAPAAKKAPAKKAPAKKAAATKTSPAKKATPAKAAAPAKKVPAAPKVMASSDKNHQQWQGLKRELTAVMSDLLYDSRRVTPDHSKSREEATAKVTAALKVLTEFAESIRLK